MISLEILSKMKNLYYTFLLLLLPALCLGNILSIEDSLEAEIDSNLYSLRHDIRIFSLADVIGRTIIPAEYEEGYTGPMPLTPGEKTVTISASRIAFSGMEDFPGMESFNVLSKTKAKHGFNFELMSKAGKTARLKIVLDPGKYLMLLYFNSEEFGEHTFFTGNKSKERLQMEGENFTYVDYKKIEAYSDLVGDTLKPYAWYDVGKDPFLLSYLSPEDSILFAFDEGTLTTNEEVREIKKIKQGEPGKVRVSAPVEIYELSFRKGADVLRLHINKRREVAAIEYKWTAYILIP